jgi:hypothetical protein
VSAALLPYVDEMRIAALAAVEPDTLWFMSELVSWGSAYIQRGVAVSRSLQVC